MVSNEKHQKHFDLVRSSHGAYLIEEEEKESVTEKEGNSPVVDAGKLNISSEDTEIKQGEEYSNDIEALEEDTAGKTSGKVVVVLC